MGARRRSRSTEPEQRSGRLRPGHKHLVYGSDVRERAAELPGGHRRQHSLAGGRIRAEHPGAGHGDLPTRHSLRDSNAHSASGEHSDTDDASGEHSDTDDASGQQFYADYPAGQHSNTDYPAGKQRHPDDPACCQPDTDDPACCQPDTDNPACCQPDTDDPACCQPDTDNSAGTYLHTYRAPGQHRYRDCYRLHDQLLRRAYE